MIPLPKRGVFFLPLGVNGNPQPHFLALHYHSRTSSIILLVPVVKRSGLPSLSFAVNFLLLFQKQEKKRSEEGEECIMHEDHPQPPPTKKLFCENKIAAALGRHSSRHFYPRGLPNEIRKTSPVYYRGASTNANGQPS